MLRVLSSLKSRPIQYPLFSPPPVLLQARLKSTVKPSVQSSLLHHNSAFFNTPRTLAAGYSESLSNIAGHTSFLLLGISYLTTDILSLRVVAMSGISLSILFQYYRPIPLKIPIRWNFLFLTINGLMVATLLAEKNEARKMNDDQKHLYETQFSKMGFTEVEFFRLTSQAIVKDLKRGQKLCEEGKGQSTMYFLMDGSVHVSAGGRHIAAIKENSFIGEMSFLTFLQEQGQETKAAATCRVVRDAKVMVWEFGDLAEYLKRTENRGLANALQAFISSDLRRKLSRMSTQNSLKSRITLA